MDTRRAIRSFIENHLASLEENAELKDTDNYFELGFVDSLFSIQLVGFIQEEFQISIESEDLDLANFNSIDRIVAFIHRKKKELGGTDE
ncbi:MAG: acyl carrier protein [Candidatus Aminicenantes bacterium]|nr:acyl carrier protein [Candidatus Aminicenantes bacterium]